MLREMTKPSCPHCHADALYVGLDRVECATHGCKNQRVGIAKNEAYPEPLYEGIDPEDFPYEYLPTPRS